MGFLLLALEAEAEESSCGTGTPYIATLFLLILYYKNQVWDQPILYLYPYLQPNPSWFLNTNGLSCLMPQSFKKSLK